MLGYMTKEEAKSLGFTNHGKYFGIPCWVGGGEENFMACTKWAPMEYVMTVFHYIEGFLRSTFWPNEEPVFQFLVGDSI